MSRPIRRVATSILLHGDRILILKRSAAVGSFQHHWSGVSGFVEPGESLEEAVRREVAEETGIAVGDIRYQSSQPWPFPASLMLGFYATAESEEIHRNAEELEDARWFTRTELRDGSAGLAGRRRSDSIARWLIRAWVEAD